jgi:hypothetical protein
MSLPQGAEPPPLPLRVAKAGRNHLNEEFTPLLPPGIGERYSQTISNLIHEALLRRVGKNPGFFKKTQPSGFFWVFLVFFWVFWVFLPRREGF